MQKTKSLTLFRFSMSLLQKIFADVPEEDMHFQPMASMNPPVWILGHLVTVLSYVPQTLGDKLTCPVEYLKFFSPGSVYSGKNVLPTKAEMLAVLELTVSKINELVPKVPEEDWSKPNPLPFFKTELPTLSDIIDNILIAHTMLHLGQMTIWRREKKLPAIIQIPKS